MDLGSRLEEQCCTQNGGTELRVLRFDNDASTKGPLMAPPDSNLATFETKKSIENVPNRLKSIPNGPPILDISIFVDRMGPRQAPFSLSVSALLYLDS